MSTEAFVPKRGPGRPRFATKPGRGRRRKYPLGGAGGNTMEKTPQPSTLKMETAGFDTERGRGRPRSHPLIEVGDDIAEEEDTNIYASSSASAAVLSGSHFYTDDSCVESQKRKRHGPVEFLTDADMDDPEQASSDVDSDVSIDVKCEALSKTTQATCDDTLADSQRIFDYANGDGEPPGGAPKRRRCGSDDPKDADYVYVEPEKVDFVQQQRIKIKGKAEFSALSKTQRREMIVTYFEGPGNKDVQQTHQHFVKQRGWPAMMVTVYLKQHTDPTYTFGKDRKVDYEELKSRYREAVAAAGNDCSKVKLVHLARELGVGGHQLWQVIHSDEELRKQIDDATTVSELRLEARRSLIAAYFINAKGDFRERRNACVRYFMKAVPGMQQRMVFNVVDRFIKTGSIRNFSRNRQLHWETRGNRVEYGKRVLDLEPNELEYLQNLQALQEEAETTMEKRADKGEPYKLGKSNNSTVRQKAPRDISAETNLTIANLQSALREKCDRIDALERALASFRNRVACQTQSLSTESGEGVT